jgi:hypothetical protein
VLWSGSRPSVGALQPVTEGNCVFMVRAPNVWPVGVPFDSPVVCQDLSTGIELWHFDIPYNPSDGPTWVGGVSQGRIYASRAGSYPNPLSALYCLDVATGTPLWVSTDPITAGPPDGGLVFAPNGDPIVGSGTQVSRIDHVTGATVWSTALQGSPVGGSGAVVRGTAVYVTQPVNGVAIKKFDLATGTFSYAVTLVGSTQNLPMIGPDGTIYQFTQESSSVCHFIALTDTGTGFVQKWSVPSGLTAFAGFGIGPDGSVYHLAPNNEIHRLDPATGATLNTTGPLPTDPGAYVDRPHVAIDAQGKLFLTTGQYSSGILASYNADLSLRWSIHISYVSSGGPVLAQNGTLLIAATGTEVIAFRDPGSSMPFCFGDGTGIACPCGNSGASGHGCASSVSAAGAQLQYGGNPSVSNDTLVLAGSGMPNSAALYFQGTGQIASGLGTAFGDGLRCAGGTIVRLGAEMNVAGTSQYPFGNEQPISLRGQVPLAGGVRTYQAWYRNAAPYCTPSTFNLTNGLQLTWGP